MARRVAGSIVAAATLLFVVVSFWGTANPGLLVQYWTGATGTWPAFTVTGVTAAGRAAGLRPGDVLDYRRLTPYERYSLDLWDSGPTANVATFVGGILPANASFNIPYMRNGAEVTIVHRTVPAPWSDNMAVILTDVLAGFAAVFGALLMIRGRERASFFGGLFLSTMSVAGLPFVYGFDGFYAIKSLALGSLVISVVLLPVVLVTLYLFVGSLLPDEVGMPTRWVFRLLYLPVVVFTCITVYLALRFVAIGDVNSFSHVVGLAVAVSYDISIAVVLAMAWYASVEPHQTQRVSVRVIFWSLLIGFSGIVANTMTVGFANAQWPLDGALSLTLLAIPFGLAYVVFTKNLYDIDFFVSRAALYAILLAIVVAVIALTENFLDHVALGRYGNIAFSFAVPIALGLSMRWIGGRVEAMLQSTLYRDKTLAHETLRSLAEDFAEAHDPDALARRVVVEIHKTFKGACAVYRQEGAAYVPYAAEGFERALAPVPQDDPAFMRLRRSRSTVDLRTFETALPHRGLLFPLSVVGRVYGAIFVGARPHEQWYDPDDQSVIRGVARELAAALLWLRDNALAIPTSALTYSLDQ